MLMMMSEVIHSGIRAIYLADLDQSIVSAM
jgi:hypothetical protein